jgi:hypothetical protein
MKFSNIPFDQIRFTLSFKSFRTLKNGNLLGFTWVWTAMN